MNADDEDVLPKLDWEYDRTFREMLGRRYRRTIAGLYDQPPLVERWIRRIIMLFLILSLLAIVASQRDALSTLVAILICGTAAVVVNISLNASTFLLVTYLICWIWMSVASGSLTGLFDVQEEVGDEVLRIVLWIIIATVTVAYVLLTYVAETLYPDLVQSGKIGWSFFRIQRGPQGNQLTYLTKARSRHFERRRLVSYQGGLDAQGRPHGAGQWLELAAMGESLTGWWEHGLPVAPFRSQEIGSGFSFSAVRVAIVGNRLEPKGLFSTQMFPAVDPEGLWYAVASIECSVSGKFYKHLPGFELFAGGAVRKEAGGMAWVLRHLITPLDETMKVKEFNSVVVSLDTSSSPSLSILPRGFSPADGKPRQSVTVTMMPDSDEEEEGSKGAEPFRSLTHHRRILMEEVERMNKCSTQVLRSMGGVPLSIQGWKYSATSSREALIFFHGFNSPAGNAAKLLGQLLCLGEFPGYILPIVFAWPAGQVLTYHLAQRNGCNNDRNIGDFSSMIRDLTCCGVRRCHLLAHSMGARTLCNIVDGFDSTCAPVVHHGGTHGLMEILTATLISPELEVDAIVPEGELYDKLRRFTDVVTLYGDQKDFALLSSILFNGMKPSAGRSLNSFYRQQVDQEGDIESDSCYANHSLRAHFAVGPNEIMSRMLPGEIHGTVSGRVQRKDLDREHKDKIFLDMDVIDTTWLEANVHSIRHSFFNINTLLIADLKEIVEFRRRASLRERTLKKGENTNVYVFMTAPSVLVNP